jgi:hypothetical protein
MTIGHPREEPAPHRRHFPWRVRDEVLKRLIAPRVVDAREHRTH